MDTLNWNESIISDESIEKIDTHEYEPQIGTDLNNEHGDIKIVIQNQDQFLLPSDSYLYLEGELKPKAGSSIDKYTKADDIAFVNNGLMYLFDRVSYKLGSEEIEGFSNPGIATTMKGLTSYSEDCNEKMSFMWSRDERNSTNNIGFIKRKNYYTSDGKFSATIPLNHIFGFCENYQKVIYGVQHTLTLRRGGSSNALYGEEFRKDDEGKSTNEKVPDGQVRIEKLSWKVPCYKISDEYKIKLYEQIESKVTLPIAYLNRQLEQTTIPIGVKEWSWSLNVTSGCEKPRYIILGFQHNKEGLQIANNALFNHCHVTNAYVELNNIRYPEYNMHIDFKNNMYVLPYKLMYDYFRSTNKNGDFPIEYSDYETMYPLLVFDISRQPERIKNTISDIKIKASFFNSVSAGTYAYALILSDRIINLQSDGNKMHIVY